MAGQERLAQIMRSIAGLTGPTGGKDFAQILFESAIPEDLAPYSPADLAELAAGRFVFIQERKPGRPKIAVSNPEGAFGDVTLIDVANDDMPFLVDSTLALLNDRNLEIRMFLHPILSVRRDSRGALKELAGKNANLSGVIRESLLHVQVARIRDPETLARLEADLVATFGDIRVAVLDWRAMLQRLKEAIAQYQASPPPISIEELTESIAFLQWLADHHFTFLGMRDYVFEGGARQGELKARPETGLGILRSPEIGVLKRGGRLVAITAEIRAFLMQPDALIITKSDVRATVHKRTAMDYVGIKLFDAEGELSGELRIVGLFTSSAYTQSPNGIPLIRRKIRQIVNASGFAPASHSGKALISVLENFPRDELFQVDAETLEQMAHGILRLEERPRTKLFLRRDRFDRFVSAFVFIPRDRFNSDVRSRVGDLLAEAFDGAIASFSPAFGEGTLVRVHYIVQRTGTGVVNPDLDALEARIIEAVQTWDDRLAEALARKGAGADLIARWRGAFPAGYRDTSDLAIAIKDIAEIEALPNQDAIAVEFLRRGIDQPHQCRMRFYRRGPPVPLSGRLPILENMGFTSVAEVTHGLSLSDASEHAVIHEIMLEDASHAPVDIEAKRGLLESTFMAVWTGAAENDVLNTLTLKEGLACREVAMLRACARYLRQTASASSVEYLAHTLVKHNVVASKLAALFLARFDPEGHGGGRAHALTSEIATALDQVASLDEDRIIRRCLNLIQAMVRTNYFQKDNQGSPRPTISFKIDSKSIEDLPEPKPFAEIFVYAPDVEAIHLRAGRIARGGIRWSDRPEDFRTEVLGLAKAQNVKNAVIVPVGAKGGFVPKKTLRAAGREAIQTEGVRTYRMFISSLLDLTDNSIDGAIIPPADTVRLDGDDPYLVVAADKGTASFSDIANGISAEHGFWLDDAFASGGSAGYDHKKMAITARGGWEAVKRHFREMDVDIETTPFTVIGVGDMSGDVFGNGMLLSRQVKLLAAFDHRDIFIDPSPDPERSFAERQRLFELPRSSWQDYDRSTISPGGSVFSRALKSIPQSPEMRMLTRLNRAQATPQAIIHALLKADADLIWFGGIGTYVRASNESHGDCGDRGNDAVRIDASELRAKVVGEGANLALTQKARVEFALRGGRINTDAVDNSAGVNSSDVEVNIKIALGVAERAGKIDRPGRNSLLVEMADEVAQLVLRNNYLQTLCLSLAIAQGTEENGYSMQLMHVLETRGMLDRKLEFLPSDAVVSERDAKGGGLTRPEHAVLMAYAKLALHEELLASDVPDDPYLSRELARYFPSRMQQEFAAEIDGHKLRREIIATMLANSMINRGGPSFVSRLAEGTGANVSDIAAAFALARDSFKIAKLNGRIDALDTKISGRFQIELYLEVLSLLRWATTWFLRHETFEVGLETLVERYRDGIEQVAASLPKYVPEAAQAEILARRSELDAAGVPPDTARRFAWLRHLQRAPDIVRIAAQTGAPLAAVAKALYASSVDLGIDRLIAEGNHLPAKDFVERRAISRLVGQIYQTHRSLVSRVVADQGGAVGAWPLWSEKHAGRYRAAAETIESLLAERTFNLARLAVAQGALADLAGG